MIFSNPVHGVIHPPNWTRPLENLDFRVTQIYGCTGVTYELPYGNCAHFHRGIDIANAHAGADVLAVADGKVTLAGADSFSGNALRVVISHNGGDWFSLYYHLENYSVKAGQLVTKGQVIGHVGSTGWSTSPHLHFEVHSSSDHLSFFDPWPHLAQNVTVHPVAGTTTNIRATPGGAIYAVAKPDGRIHRASDGADLGACASWRKWGGVSVGPSYEVGGVSGNRWEAMLLDGAYRYVASPLAVRSVS